MAARSEAAGHALYTSFRGAGLSLIGDGQPPPARPICSKTVVS